MEGLRPDLRWWQKIDEEEVDGSIAAETDMAPPLSPLERRDFDYSALEEAMAHLDGVVRHAMQALRSPDLARSRHTTSPPEMPAPSSKAAPDPIVPAELNDASTFRAGGE